MNDLNAKTAYPLSDSLKSILNSLAKIEEGKISSTDMLCRMLLIEGSPAWRKQGINSTLEDAQREYQDTDAKLSVDKSIYLHIAKKALTEAAEGSSVGLDNARESIEKGFALATDSLKRKGMDELRGMIYPLTPSLAQR